MSITLLRRTGRVSGPGGSNRSRAGAAAPHRPGLIVMPWAWASQPAAGPASRSRSGPRPGRQLLHGVQVAAVQRRRAAAAGPVGQPVQPATGQAVDGPADGGLVHARMRGGLSSGRPRSARRMHSSRLRSRGDSVRCPSRCCRSARCPAVRATRTVTGLAMVQVRPVPAGQSRFRLFSTPSALEEGGCAFGDCAHGGIGVR